MLKAYLRRYDGVTRPVTVQHQGQHLGVSEGKVRFGRLFWEREAAEEGGEEGGFAELETVVPLLDTLVVTRVSPVNGERVVFHGVVTEASVDGELATVIAVDNPAQERLYDQPWWKDAPLYPSDQAAPEAASGSFSTAVGGPVAAGPQPVQGAQTLGGLPLTRPGAPGHVRPAPAEEPAARPGGHPAAPPAVQPLQWQRPPEGAAAASRA